MNPFNPFWHTMQRAKKSAGIEHVVPINYMYEKRVEATLTGFEAMTLDLHDKEFDRLMRLSEETCLAIMNAYKIDYEFFEPELAYRPTDNVFVVRVRMVTKKRYGEIQKSMEHMK